MDLCFFYCSKLTKPNVPYLLYTILYIWNFFPALRKPFYRKILAFKVGVL